MDLITFLAHIPTYPFTLCEHIMVALKAMCELRMECYEEWGDSISCKTCQIDLGYSILNQPKGNISIDWVIHENKKYFLHADETPTKPPVFQLSPQPKLRCMEEHHNA